MNRLSIREQVQVISALVEGHSIRSVERMTGIHRDTIMRLIVRVGDGCDNLMDEEMRSLTCERLQLDEIWCYVGMKQKTAKKPDVLNEEYGTLTPTSLLTPIPSLSLPSMSASVTLTMRGYSYPTYVSAS
jgi:hypothetical protein